MKKTNGFTLVELLICISMTFVAYSVLMALWTSTDRSVRTQVQGQLAQNVTRQLARRISTDFRNAEAMSIIDSQESQVLLLKDVATVKSKESRDVKYHIKEGSLWRQETLSDGTVTKDHPVSPPGLSTTFSQDSDSLLHIDFAWNNPSERENRVRKTSLVVASRRDRI